ncbi:hypothetical protein [Glycomyces tarimensis]
MGNKASENGFSRVIEPPRNNSDKEWARWRRDHEQASEDHKRWAAEERRRKAPGHR